MQRYFIKNNYRQNDIIIADDSMYKHMTKVMRMEKGEHVICIDEDKHVCLCEIIDLKQGLLQIKEELQENNELDVEVTARKIQTPYQTVEIPDSVILQDPKTIRLDRAGGNSSLANVHFQTQRGVVTYQLSLGNGKIKKSIRSR